MSRFLMKRAEARINHNGEVVFAPCLVAADEGGVTALERVKIADLVMCEVRKPRNLKFHRKFFALVKLLYENLPEASAAHYASQDEFLDALKWAAGVRETFKRPGGEIGERPGSINFAKMDDTSFAEFYDKVIDLACTKIIPGMDSDALREEILDLLGG